MDNPSRIARDATLIVAGLSIGLAGAMQTANANDNDPETTPLAVTAEPLVAEESTHVPEQDYPTAPAVTQVALVSAVTSRATTEVIGVAPGSIFKVP